MEVRVRLFAALRERAGAGEIELELPDGARVSDALAQLSALTDGVSVVIAVNQEYADAAVPLHSGDEVALIPPVSAAPPPSGHEGALTPPVSGGSVSALHARVTDEPLALDPLLERVRDPRA